MDGAQVGIAGWDESASSTSLLQTSDFPSVIYIVRTTFLLSKVARAGIIPQG